jgi:hypothetical protein
MQNRNGTRLTRTPNQALKLTRLAAWWLGGPAFGEDRGVRSVCPSPAVQLNAGVRWQEHR